eukprot:2135016-Rhodomonas_salina.1
MLLGQERQASSGTCLDREQEQWLRALGAAAQGEAGAESSVIEEVDEVDVAGSGEAGVERD